MKAKDQTQPINEFQPTSPLKIARLKERRLYELDRVYLRQLHRLSQIVGNAKLKRDRIINQPTPNSLDELTNPDTVTQTQKLIS